MSVRIATFLTIFFAALVAALPSVSAGTIGLSWNPSAGATGYRVYYGPSEGNYFANALYDGPSTQVTLNSAALADCTTWHFAVTAYNGFPGESDHSNSVSSWPRPRVTRTTPESATQGDSFTLTIEGGSFSQSATIEIDNPDVALQNSSISCEGIQFLATVEPTAENVRPAQVGEFTITVTNPDGLSGSGTFEVVVNPSRFDINRSLPETTDRLDGMDVVWLARRFPSQESDVNSDYDPDYDFDGDGWIDGNDLVYVGSNFGRCWNGSGWTVAACP